MYMGLMRLVLTSRLLPCDRFVFRCLIMTTASNKIPTGNSRTIVDPMTLPAMIEVIPFGVLDTLDVGLVLSANAGVKSHLTLV